MSNIADAIKQAQEAAAGAATEGAGAVVQHQPAGGAVSTATRGAPLGFDDLASDGIQVDAWLKVNYFGFTFGEDVFKELPAVGIDFSRLAYNYTVRFGNPATYRKSYDRQVDSRGGSWAQTLVDAAKIDPRATEYRSVEIPFIILEDVKIGGKQFEAGQVLGYGTPVTGWKSFEGFMRDAIRAGVDTRSGKVEVKLTHVPRKTEKGQWGIIDFTDVKPVDVFPFEGE